MSEESSTEWVGTPLDTEDVDPHAIVEITVEFDEGEELLTPKINERFGSYDLNEASALHLLPLQPHLEGGQRLEMGSRRRRRSWSHGVEVRRRSTNCPGDRRASEVLIRRICLRYEDDRKVCFVPEAGERFFSRDNVHRVVGMLHKGSEVLEWGLSSSERHPGRGPYDTGAV